MKKIFMLCLLSGLFLVSIDAMESSTDLSDEEQRALMEARISDLEKQAQYLLEERRKLESEVARLEMAPNEIFVFGAEPGKNITSIQQFALQ